ncbi:MAG: TlpA disulfide reductase family protein [Myxococcota bacterium]
MVYDIESSAGSPHLHLLRGAVVALGATALMACGGAKAGGPSAANGGDEAADADGGAATDAAAAAGTGNEVGSKAPEVLGEALMGEGPTTVADAAGKILIVDFWATWCDPCRDSLPKYQEIVDKYEGDVAVIGVSVDEADDVSADEVKAFVTDLGVSFGVVWDKEKKTVQPYDPPKMPTSYVIDQEGIIRFVHAGFETGDEAKIVADIDSLR